jgi:hypothetical protein
MPRSVAGPNTSRVQQKMMKRTRSQTPPSAVSKAEVERRQKNPNLRDEQIDIERRTNKRAAERRQKDLARAGAKDLAAQRAGRKAGEAAGKRMTQAATKALTRGVPALGAALTGAEMLEDYVGSRAEADRAARRSYNERASTDMDTAARGVREAMSGDRMRRLQGEGMKKGGTVRGCGRAARGHGKARMIKMKGA